MFIVRVNGLHPDHSTYTTWGMSCISLLDAPCVFFACQYFLSLHKGDVAKVLLLPRRTRHVWSNCVLVHQWGLVFRCTYSAFVPFPQLLARVATLDSLRWWGAGQMRSAHQTDWIRLVLFFNIFFILLYKLYFHRLPCFHVFSLYFLILRWRFNKIPTFLQRQFSHWQMMPSHGPPKPCPAYWVWVADQWCLQSCSEMEKVGRFWDMRCV